MNRNILKLNKLAAAAILAVIGFNLIKPAAAEAQYYSQEGVKYQIVVDKKISADGGKNYYDNIAASVKTFSEGNQISYRIVVENKGKETLKDVKLTDYLPKYLSLLFYPGTFDKSKNILEVNIKTLEPGESKAYLVIALIKNLPSGNYSRSKLTLVNKACTVNDKASDCDEARYYAVPKVIPTTGSADILLQTIGMLMAVGTGLSLRRKVRGY